MAVFRFSNMLSDVERFTKYYSVLKCDVHLIAFILSFVDGDSPYLGAFSH
jgi:hypothetical protein